MKELSIEEKAKRYDEAIKRANELIYVSDKDSLQCKTAEHIFPELKKFENDEIRKWLIGYFNQYIIDGMPQVFGNGLNVKDVITWLEKQGDRKPAEWYREDEQNLNACLGYIPDEFLRRWLTDIIHVKYDKPADKVEPKFKVGDWCIDNEDSEIFQIMKVLDNTYTYKTNEGKEYSCTHYSLENDVRPWTIQDAKDGDVLATDSWLYMFKYTNNKALIQFHCKCPINGKTHKWSFLSDDSYLDIYIDANIHPATKEQRDTLEMAMTNAGYRWNKEELKLEKI